jgi:predicted short-subunit dehydrogenase-like oxidoreductase (DUF2520 family)
VTVGIIGPGRAGLGLALALRGAGIRVVGVHGRRRKAVPRGIRLSVGGTAPWLARADVVLLAVRDDSLGPLVKQLAKSGDMRAGQVMLHLSGALTSRVLAPLARAGAHIGSLHPLMTVSTDPRRAAERLRGATFTIEGDPAAVRSARRLVRAFGGRAVPIAPGHKVRYHAGAVFASNYVTVVLATAEELLVESGFTRKAARAALAPLARASLENIAATGPVASLTGPVARGDVATVRAHLGALAPRERTLYRHLARATIDLARDAGLGRAAERRLSVVLGHS